MSDTNARRRADVLRADSHEVLDVLERWQRLEAEAPTGHTANPHLGEDGRCRCIGCETCGIYICRCPDCSGGCVIGFLP